MQVVYPINEYSTIKVNFGKQLTQQERERAINIANYWSQINYNPRLAQAWMSDDNSLYLSVDEERSVCRRHTQDLNKHRNKYNPLALLGEYLTYGTPTRKTRNFTRAFDPVADVNSVKAY